MTEQPIRDAASLILLDRSGAEPRVLMGRRRPDQVFLPNVFVFPGGRVDDGDRLAPSCEALDDAEARLLAMPGPQHHAPYSTDHVRSFALAAIRETFEETGFAIGDRGAEPGELNDVPEAWRSFLATGVRPQLSALQFFIRAITPPGRPRRYDTRFFLADAEGIAFKGGAIDDELSEIGWFGLESLATLEVPTMTRRVITELTTIASSGLAPAGTRVVPFYREHDGVMLRAELSLVAPCS